MILSKKYTRMFRKFQRYLSKNIPENALATVARKDVLEYDYRGVTSPSANLNNLFIFKQRQNIQPREVNPVFNKDRIGLHMRQQFGPKTNEFQHFLTSSKMNKRRAFLFQVETNHMQSTPMYRRDYWTIHIQNLGFSRSHAMLWGRNCDDPFRTWGIRYEMAFANMNECVDASNREGYEYELIYPHERYHENRAYADNFKFLKESISDVEDEEELVMEIMQKLV
jgi:hypothetical protein